MIRLYPHVFYVVLAQLAIVIRPKDRTEQVAYMRGVSHDVIHK